MVVRCAFANRLCAPLRFVAGSSHRPLHDTPPLDSELDELRNDQISESADRDHWGSRTLDESAVSVRCRLRPAYPGLPRLVKSNFLLWRPATKSELLHQVQLFRSLIDETLPVEFYREPIDSR